MQCSDEEFKPLTEYLEVGVLPNDEQQSEKLILEQSRYTMVDKVLYFVDSKSPHHQRNAVLRLMRTKIIEEVHAGRFSTHFALKGTLTQSYYWD